MRKGTHTNRDQSRIRSFLERSLMFWQLTISYALLLVIPLIMTVIVINFTHNNLLEQSKNTNNVQLENTMRIVESSLSVIDDLSATLNSNATLLEFLSKSEPDKGKLTYAVLQTMNSLPVLKDSNKLINGYFIYSLVNDILVAPNQGFTNSDLYYQKYYRYADMSYNDFKKQILYKKYNRKVLSPHPFIYGEDSNPTILYINSIYNSNGRFVGQTVFRINVEKIRELMLPAISESNGRMYIFDNNGFLLLSYPKDPEPIDGIHGLLTKTSDSFEQEIDGTRIFLSYRISEKNGWTYLITVPSDILYSQSDNIMNTLLLNLLIIYTIIVVIVCLSLRYNRKPLVNMVNTLPTDMVPSKTIIRKGINFINSVVMRIVSDNAQLENRLTEQKILINNMVLSELESGEVKSQKDLDRLISYLNITLNGKYYRGAYLIAREPFGSGKAEIDPECYQDILDFLASDSKHFPMVMAKERNHFALLYQQGEEEDEQVYSDIFRSIYNTLYNKYNLDAIICLGHACDNLLNVYQSFEAAQHLFDAGAGVPSNYKFLLECHAETESDQYYAYTMKSEQKLINMISTYNVKGIHLFLIDVFKKNFMERSLNSFMRKILFARILGTLMSFTESDNLLPELKGSLTNFEPIRFFELVEEQCIQICESLREKNEKSKHNNLEQLLEYIHKNIYNYDLTLSLLASKFNMSESHLSVSIKDYTGQNFSSYIEELRMKKANELLKKGSLTVKEIAERVGYSNPHSFRRAYKRVFGCSPSQFTGN